jgi:hypothetical protein
MIRSAFRAVDDAGLPHRRHAVAAVVTTLDTTSESREFGYRGSANRRLSSL